MSTPHFHSLVVKRIDALTADAAQITFAIPPNLRDAFEFKSGQFLTLRAQVNGESVRRSYSICSTPSMLAHSQEISVGIKRVEGGAFSTWATTQLQTGNEIDVMPPDGRFIVKKPDAKMRLGIAAGSGITPILSIAAHTLASESSSRFTLVYGNQRTNTIMFGEALQDLKDRYPGRLQLIHILSRQATELPLSHGRIDAEKIKELTSNLIDPKAIDEAFICGPEAMIEALEPALQTAGITKDRIHSERFISAHTTKTIALRAVSTPANGQKALKYSLEVILDGKTNAMQMGDENTVLDVALEAGLDLPYACKGGVCCTCRAKVIEGKVSMDKNYTLEQWEIDKGFVLTCQARCQTQRVVVSFDER
ncbi:1,2-phenylacetyl-CoA epoxidase subunit PaaE [Variovorax sp. PCZ-1]|uniref:1,2-phenylacetyl-CoA epoxidase subunit PaaE n=1 Tax=Variovorax sp. PCZ-1 TaxID=2835533 RepID=UPI001BCA9FBD|nr:1,2-phenylacetyl-CoA epoxidase subunit PaaE [Variovorax sp. PCZ-1]MBS7808965.1 phenylacetate-CoA oxygenase/reductase subunit PaaK [Variovorax sp. PCZ-1]